PADIYTLPLHDALPIFALGERALEPQQAVGLAACGGELAPGFEACVVARLVGGAQGVAGRALAGAGGAALVERGGQVDADRVVIDRKSTRLNSSHVKIS